MFSQSACACLDGSDEKNCPPFQCKPGMFQCKNGKAQTSVMSSLMPSSAGGLTAGGGGQGSSTSGNTIGSLGSLRMGSSLSNFNHSSLASALSGLLAAAGALAGSNGASLIGFNTINASCISRVRICDGFNDCLGSVTRYNEKNDNEFKNKILG